MAGVDLIVRGGMVVVPGGIVRASLAVQHGVIVGVSDDDAMPRAREIVDAAGRHVIPGIVDPHVHFRSPGFEYKEDWATGTSAAAFGGVTTVLEMPNSDPPTATAEGLRVKQAIAARDAYVDYGLYGMLGQGISTLSATSRATV